MPEPNSDGDTVETHFRSQMAQVREEIEETRQRLYKLLNKERSLSRQMLDLGIRP